MHCIHSAKTTVHPSSSFCTYLLSPSLCALFPIINTRKEHGQVNSNNTQQSTKECKYKGKKGLSLNRGTRLPISQNFPCFCPIYLRNAFFKSKNKRTSPMIKAGNLEILLYNNLSIYIYIYVWKKLLFRNLNSDFCWVTRVSEVPH